MKKKIVAVCLVAAMTMSLSACSMSDIKNKFTGGSSSDSGYNVEDCLTIDNYKGVEVDCAVSDDEVNSEVTTLQTQHEKTKKIKNRKAKLDDSAFISYVGKVNGKEFEGGTSKGYSLKLGSNTFIQGFEDGVVGMKPGETKDLHLKFPEDYSNEDLKGKKVVFTVKLKYIEETITPKVDDAFIAKNTEYKTVDEFKKAKKKELVDQNAANAGQTAMNSLTDKVEVKTYPESLINMYKDQLDKQFKSMLEQYKMKFEDYLSQANMKEEDYKKQLDEVSKEQTKIHLIVEYIAKKENISVSEDDKTKQIDQMIQSYGAENKDALKKQMNDNYGVDLDQYITQMLLQKKVQEFVGKEATLKNNVVE